MNKITIQVRQDRNVQKIKHLYQGAGIEDMQCNCTEGDTSSSGSSKCKTSKMIKNNPFQTFFAKHLVKKLFT